MSDLIDHSDAYDSDDMPRRPPPPRTWRDRVDDLGTGERVPGRLVAAVVGLLVVGVIGWRLLTPPAPPPEVAIPLAEPAGTSAGVAPPAPGTGDPSVVGNTDVGGGSAAGATGPAGGAAGAGSTTGEVVVHVVGAVVAPGVQRLPAGARVVDAVDAAGGASGDADLARINLAAALVDGQQVYVLRIGELAPPAAAGATGAGGGDAGQPAAGDTAGGDTAAGLVDINRASATELEELPGVGPTTAEAIIAHREQNGPFAAVDDLIDVRGIGDAKLEQLRPHATV